MTSRKSSTEADTASTFLFDDGVEGEIDLPRSGPETRDKRRELVEGRGFVPKALISHL
jgi:hypothetical protein